MARHKWKTPWWWDINVETRRSIYHIKSYCCDIQGCNTNCAFVGCNKNNNSGYLWPFNDPGSQSPASHRGGPGSISGQPMWDWWRTKCHWGQVFLRVLRFSPVNIISPVLHTDLHLQVAHTRRTNGRRLKKLPKSNVLSEIGSNDRKKKLRDLLKG